MQRNLLWALSLGLLCQACSSESSQAAAPVPTKSYSFDLEHLAPDHAILVASTTDAATIRELATQNTWAQLFAEETLWDLSAALTDDPIFWVDDPIRPGQILTQLEGAAVWYLIMDRPKGSGAMAFVLEKGRQDRSGLWTWLAMSAMPGVDAVTQEVDGVSVQLFEDRNALAIFATDTIEGLAFADSEATAIAEVQSLLARAKGDRSGSVVETEEHKDFAKHRSPGAIASLYWPISRSTEAWNAGAPAEVFQILQGFAIPDIGWVGADFVLGEGEYWKLTARAPIPEGSLPAAVLGHARSLPLDLLEDFPAESVGIAIADVDWLGAFQTALAELEARVPNLAKSLNYGFERFERDTGLQLQNEVLAPFEGPIGMSLVAVPWRWPDFRRNPRLSIQMGLLQQSPLWIAKVRDGDTVQRTLRLMTDAPEKQRPPLRIMEHEAQPLGHHNEYLQPFSVVTEEANPTALVALQIPPLTRGLMRVDRQETLDRGVFEGLKTALERHRSASLAVCMESGLWAAWAMDFLRPLSQSAGDRLERVRWPATYSLVKRLKGHTVAAIAVQDGMASVTIEAR